MSNKRFDIQGEDDNATKNWSVGGQGLFNSCWGAILIPLIFGYPIFVGFNSALAVKIFALVCIWWFFLAVFWILPVFSYFDAERNWISNYRKSNKPYLQKLIGSVGFYIIYWPIFMRKEVFFWFVFGIVAIYYLIGGR